MENSFNLTKPIDLLWIKAYKVHRISLDSAVIEFNYQHEMSTTLPIHRTRQLKGQDLTSIEYGFNPDLLLPLIDTAKNSNYIAESSFGEFTANDVNYQIPRFVFLGDKGGGDTIRLAIVAGVHGDEPEGVEAVVRFLLNLERRPSLARNYHIYVYPVINPVAFAAHATNGPTGGFARQVWRGSSQPEVLYLERELRVIQFHGVISLQGHSESQGFRVRMSRPSLISPLAQPALEAANRWLPADATPRLAAEGVSNGGGFLTITNELRVTPFDVILEPPRQAARYVQINSVNAALAVILDKYREILSFRQNI